MKKLNDESIDLILTDPPYNTGMKKNNNSGRLNDFFNDNYTEEEYKQLVEKTVKEMYRILKNNRAGYIFINIKSLSIWMNELQKTGFDIKNVIVWDKCVHGLNYQNYAYRYELIIYFTKGKFNPNNKTTEDKQKQFYTDVWRVKRIISAKGDDRAANEHETVKPTLLLRVILRHASKENDVILDPFGGSGSTAVACQQMKRRYILFEKEKKYCDIAIKRLNQTQLHEFI